MYFLYLTNIGNYLANISAKISTSIISVQNKTIVFTCLPVINDIIRLK